MPSLQDSPSRASPIILSCREATDMSSLQDSAGIFLALLRWATDVSPLRLSCSGIFLLSCFEYRCVAPTRLSCFGLFLLSCGGRQICRPYGFLALPYFFPFGFATVLLAPLFFAAVPAAALTLFILNVMGMMKFVSTATP
jgi:hypothetical protein